MVSIRNYLLPARIGSGLRPPEADEQGKYQKEGTVMESTMSEEPRGEGTPEESLHAAGAEPVPPEGEAGRESMAQGEREEEQQARPEGAEEVSRVEAQPEGAEETNQEAAPSEGTEGTG